MKKAIAKEVAVALLRIAAKQVLKKPKRRTKAGKKRGKKG